jgi:hypothetical protein
MNTKELRLIIQEEVEKTLQESYYAQGIPEYVVNQIASNCSEDLRRHLIIFANQSAQSSRHQQQILVSAKETLVELEKEMKELIQQKIELFFRQV